MALVAYSDSEASDSEPETTAPQPQQAPKKPTTSTTATTSNTNTNNKPPIQPLVDRTNPRKIRVALPDVKPEHNDDTDGPRKKPKLGGGGGAFSGFNSFLPAPKKTATTASSNASEKKAPARKIFSLKTGAAPGFDREADAEMRNERAFGALGGDGDEDETIPKAGSMRDKELDFGKDSEDQKEEEAVPQMKKPEEVKLKGNPMMFKPLSVGRAQQKKRKAVSDLMPAAAAVRRKEDVPTVSSTSASVSASVQETPTAAAPAPPKPKISLFSLSASDDSTPTTSTAPSATSYEPLVYTPLNTAPAGPSPAPEDTTTTQQSTYQPASTASDNTLSTIADDLNLSKAQRRQLFGRNAPESVAASSRVLHFNTDQEYVTNQELAHTELAAQQHNPVRAIAPGKHTLQQLVNAASTQREALEESFAAGRRNKREAGAKYGW
ncbi:hypothetical protein CBS115989_6419 [Aspergillus niger]|uniref:Mitotic checkpoint regulator, MAD2B-interacting-domain-containing protein n=3 Tax=Aspergillus niger TaxID=5061 RepID=A0A370CDQ3_ASPNG|nr:uncharacterized protein BO96DRAFT_407506 [Aspergillus niger CBS 101883]KAI2816945.1 hypothetical protein CBS115989_6419 [Aspergillus niger]RDH25281.1 hypothetical protein M747DRAFT_292069 [Aspergillus niger ATCC 13496]KAI2840323.1 hypothetical protein CBS11232_9138 [Aspergillus niger]KAI2878991.1 hypothetical protein CBS115988_2767 [Aspergillus niger]KAI2890685.1 hypothetical protein CBS11852_6359 [Aspergillus niger]